MENLEKTNQKLKESSGKKICPACKCLQCATKCKLYNVKDECNYFVKGKRI